MNDSTVALLVTRIQRGLVEVLLQPNTVDLWRMLHVDVRASARGQSQILEWLITALPWHAYAKLAELPDPLDAKRVVHLVHVHDADDDSIPEPFQWFNMQDLPPLAFMNERQLFEERTRPITELVIAHQNPYKAVPGFR